MEDIPAPRLPDDLPWFNVDRPLTKDDLLGRVVVLEFWTSCSVNSLLTLPVLDEVRRRLADLPVLWIGVHTPKFDHELDPDWVRQSVRRLGIKHPVVSDVDRKIWTDYDIEAWPTIVVVGPDGMIYGAAAGEPDPDPMERVIRQVFEHYEHERRPTPVPTSADQLPLRPEAAGAGALAYPGKVYATAKGLFIADTSHNQVVACILNPNGTATEARRFGSGEAGFIDGSAGVSELRAPNGMSLDPDGVVLWVADTGNHAIRRIDLIKGDISTVAGTGDRGHEPPPAGLLQATSVHLRSPWDVVWDSERGFLTVAMAGSNQLYLYEPTHSGLAILSGSGAQAREDGSLEDAAYAQPSGLALLDNRLYVADAETSCVRQVDFAARTVTTICGGDLFDYGDRDGQGDEVLLQHPCGIVADPERGRLLLADTYNHKIKEVLPDGSVRTLYGNGRALKTSVEGPGPGPDALPDRAGPDAAMFYAPEGVDVRDGRLFVADTANHRIVGIDLKTDRCWVVYGAPATT